MDVLPPDHVVSFLKVGSAKIFIHNIHCLVYMLIKKSDNGFCHSNTDKSKYSLVISGRSEKSEDFQLKKKKKEC